MSANAATRRLIFVHLGRTGGTTLRHDVLYPNLDPRTVCLIDGNEPPARGMSFGELLALPRKEQEQFRAVVGHMPFGLRDHLPWPESWHYVTLVRDPVTRVVSEYYQVRGTKSHPLHPWAMRHTLEEWAGRFLNGLCATLSNAGYGREYDSPQAMYREATRNAAACSLVGLTERYDETVRRLCRLFDWPVPRVGRHYACTPKGRALTDGERRAILDHHSLDLALYEECRGRFEREAQGAGPAVPGLAA